MKNFLISVIIVVYNGETHLEKTVKSIINQTYKPIELIIIDGNSSDSSLEIIKKYDSQIDYWISKPDMGISDAFNKALKKAKGDYINFQGCGDGFLSPDSVEKVFKDINHKYTLISSRIQRVSFNGDKIYNSKYIKKFNKRSLLFKMTLPHQGLFTSRFFFENYGLFDINNKFCMDYDILLRSYGDFPEIITKNIISSIWREDGMSINRLPKALYEFHKTRLKNGIANKHILKTIYFYTLFKLVLKSIFKKVRMFYNK